MKLRRLDRSLGILGLGLTLTLAGSAEAQLSGGRWILTPQANSGRGRAVEAKPAPVVVVDQPGFNSTVFRQPVAYLLVPAILMSDGSVFANFGGGFEQVSRSCAGGVVVGQPQVIGGNGRVLSPAAPRYMQPAPAQMTASQQMLPSVQAQSAAAAMRSRSMSSACFSRDGSGRLFAFR
jgi:hypothetical protein